MYFSCKETECTWQWHIHGWNTSLSQALRQIHQAPIFCVILWRRHVVTILHPLIYTEPSTVREVQKKAGWDNFNKFSYEHGLQYTIDDWTATVVRTPIVLLCHSQPVERDKSWQLAKPNNDGWKPLSSTDSTSTYCCTNISTSIDVKL